MRRVDGNPHYPSYDPPPAICSIYHPDFWWVERVWELHPIQFFHIFNGTPFKSVIWRLMGVRIGKRVFDDGVHISEPLLTTVGDECSRSREQDPVRLAGGRHLQVRPNHARRRLHGRGWRIRALRRDDGGGLGTRCRLLSHEGRDCSTTHAVGGEPGEGDLR